MTMRVLMLTSVWPTPEHPERAPFVVRQAIFLRRHGVDLDVFHVDGRKNPTQYLKAWRQVHTMINRGAYDLIHAQWAQAALPALPRRVPLVVTFRGSDVEGIKDQRQRQTAAGRVLRGLARRVARIADEAILVADRLAKSLPSREYHIIPSGLDLDLFRPLDRISARDQLALRRDGRYVLFAASPEKAVKRFGLAKAAVARTGTAELIVASEVAPEKMPLYMSACDALLLTSAHEGSPNVVKEALACNLPIVSADVGDVAQRVRGVSGCFVCSGDDPDTYARALRSALSHGPIEGRAAVAELDENSLTRRVVQVYQKALLSSIQRRTE